MKQNGREPEKRVYITLEGKQKNKSLDTEVKGKLLNLLSVSRQSKTTEQRKKW